MDKVEFKPSFLSNPKSIFLFFLIAVSLLFGFSLLPSSLNLYQELPGDSQALMVLVIIIIATVIPWIFVPLLVLYVTGRRILLENNLFIFSTRSLLGNWNIRSFNLSDIGLLNIRESRSVVFTGKVLVPIINYYLVFNHTNGTKEEISLSGWDNNTLKDVAKYIKGKYPQIKINTPFYRDSPEALSGLTEYTAQK